MARGAQGSEASAGAETMASASRASAEGSVAVSVGPGVGVASMAKGRWGGESAWWVHPWSTRVPPRGGRISGAWGPAPG